MKLSILVCTRNRAHVITPCLDSIAAAIVNAGPADAEIVIADNGSTDGTPEIIAAWKNRTTVPVQFVIEPRPGRARGMNRALSVAHGEIFAFTDDDCRLDRNYVNDLLRHDAADTEPVVRGGRTELGDPTDQPVTIDTNPERERWSLAQNSARHRLIAGVIFGCNMVVRRTIIDRLGPFDENFGPGSVIGSGDDTEFLWRAYVAGIVLEHVPDMTVYHFHGRKTPEDVRVLFTRYTIGFGALCMKYFLKHPNLTRTAWWDIKNAAKEILTGTNRLLPNSVLPDVQWSYCKKVSVIARGATRFILARKDDGARRRWAEARHGRQTPEQLIGARAP